MSDLPAPPAKPPAAPVTRGRKLHLGHFAFMRSVVEGIDVRQSWDRYCRVEGDDSSRTIRSTIHWIRDEFAAAAKRQARPGTARLVLLDASRLGEPRERLPTLDVFARERGIEDFFEREQLEAYEAAFGTASRRASRRARLVAQQLEALRWLESLVAEPPRAGDALASWLNPTLVQLLSAGDLFTLAQLAERINGVGRLWTGSIKSLGPAKGQRIEQWLRQHEGTTGLVLGRHVTVARRQLYGHELDAVVAKGTGIRPLEKFVVPAELDGTAGVYRRPQAQCLLKARTDYDAILAWLRSKHGLTPEQKAQLKARRKHRDSGFEQPHEWLQSLSNTQRAYRKEAERFLLWAIVEKGKPLSSMTQEDCVGYREFLGDPMPRSRWCGDRARERWSPLWRPFEGPLSPAAQRQAIVILGNLFGFLVDHNYLMGNPWASVTVQRGLQKVNAGRSLTKKQWRFVESELDELEASGTNERLKVALHLLYATGLRLSEVVAARTADLQYVEYPGDKEDAAPLAGWVLRVVGKGQKEREVPVPDGVVSEIEGYLKGRGVRLDDQVVGGAHLLGKAAGGLRLDEGAVDARDGIAASTLYGQLKGFFEACAMELKVAGDAAGAARLGKASTHWLRHTHASHAIAAGMPIEIAQQNLGHASLATTTVYVRTEEKRRMRAVAEFWTSSKGRAAD